MVLKIISIIAAPIIITLRNIVNLKHILLLSIVFFTASVSATNGYFRLGYGHNSIAMGGTGTALAQDNMAAAINPATIFGIDKTYGVELTLFNPKRGFEVTGASPMSAQAGEFPLMNGEVRSGSELFVLPSFGYQRAINDQWAMSLAIYGNGGMNTDYPAAVFGAGDTGVDLSQLFISTAFAYKATENTTLGFAPIVAVQSFEARGVGSFAGFSQDAANLSDNGHDTVFGYGARLGITQKLTSSLTLGASYQTQIDFAEFDKYQGLFAENGDMDIPATYNLGVAFDNADFTVALDYQKINYSEIASIANPLLPNIMMSALGSDTGAGFGWNDMEVFKLGAAFKQESGVIRAGISYGEQPIDSSEVLFNILAPGVQELHYTAGYEFTLNGEVDYAVTLSYSPSKSVKGLNPLYQSQQQYIELDMEQFELTFACAF